jgi:DNA-binding IclR family transcriptional regulator
MRFPLHATSTGKVLLAYLSPSQRASLLPKSLPSYTTRTITDSAKLHAELDRVRAQGYAISNEELEEHLVAIGAPVRDHDGIVIAAISLSGPASRLPRERMSALIPQVMQTAEEISRVLGYR